MRVRILFVASTLSLLGTSAAQTVWTGSASTSWSNPANWTAGVPDQDTPAQIAPAANQPVVTGQVDCRHLTVAAGTALTVNSGATLGVHGDASFAASVLGTGRIKWFGEPGSSTPPPAQVTFTNQASIPNGVVDDDLDATCTDLRVGNSFSAATASNGPTILLHGATTLGTASFFGTPQGQVICDPTGSLTVVGSLYLYWNITLPGTVAIGTLVMNPTSSITPTTGVVHIQPGTALQIACHSYPAVNLTVDVPAGASFRFDDDTQASSNAISLMDTSGSIILNSSDPMVVRAAQVSGSLSLSGDCYLSPPVGSTSPVTVSPGASLSLGVYYSSVDSVLRVSGMLQVDGHLRVGNGSAATVMLQDTSPTNPGRLVVSSTGTLTMQGPSFSGIGYEAAIFGDGNHHASVEIHGTLAAHDFRFAGLGPDGLQLLAGSTIGTAPFDLQNGRFDDGAPTAGSTLLTLARTAATRLDGAEFAATNSTAAYAVRATTPHAVDIRNAFGALGDESFEDDPLAVISWTDGVSFIGSATPGCLGLAETRTNSAPQVGNGAFAIRCENAHPSGAVLQVIATGGLPSSIPFLGVAIWIDPISPFVASLVTAAPTGVSSLPLPIPNNAQLVGLSLWSQALLLEPVACAPSGFSGSTAIRIDIVP